MKVMLDTNILISAFIFKSKIMNNLIEILSKEHMILLASYTIEELREVTKEKFKVDKKYLERFLEKFPFELVKSPKNIEKRIFNIRDEDDYIILYTAILGNVDIFITGDRHFEDVKIAKPQIMGANEFLKKFG